MKTKRVLVSKQAIKIIDLLKVKYGELIFHQSAGCCDGSAPMCFSKGELYLNETDICLGEIHGCFFYMSKDQFEYWKHSQLFIDITKGRGASFSLEAPLGVRFITKSKLYTTEELLRLEDLQKY